MIKGLTIDDRGLYHVETAHGTYYVIDLDNMRGMRVPAEGRNEMRADNDWFFLNDIKCNVGQPMFMLCSGIAQDDIYTWRLSTEVSSITKEKK